jgi:cytochrome c biogenesis protein CcmG/thiol:disulfide interchange protein DsbE
MSFAGRSRTIIAAVVAVVVVVVSLVGLVGLVVGMLGGGGRQGGPNTLAASPPLLKDRIRSTDRAPLPDLTLEGFAGGEAVRLADYRGQPLLVNFWATWCAPCVEEMPAFQRVARRLADRVAVLGVDVQDAPSNAQPFVRELGIDYDLAIDPAAALYREVRAYGMPTTLFVDSSGMIVYRHTGALDDAGLTALIESHLDVTE